MTKITIDEDLNFDKTNFKTLKEFLNYLQLLNLISELQPINILNEEQVIYSKNVEIMDGDHELPQWQKDVIEKRLQDIEEGKTSFQDFDSALREIEKEL